MFYGFDQFLGILADLTWLEEAEGKGMKGAERGLGAGSVLGHMGVVE